MFRCRKKRPEKKRDEILTALYKNYEVCRIKEQELSSLEQDRYVDYPRHLGLLPC